MESSCRVIREPRPAPRNSGAAECVEAAGLLKKRPGYYTLMLATNTLAFATSLWLLTLVHSVWATIVLAALLGFVSGQLGFQLHDSGHRQMFPSRRVNTVIGILTGNVIRAQGDLIPENRRVRSCGNC